MLHFLLQIALGFGLSIFGFAWFPCCDPSECDMCDSDPPSSFNVTVAGIVDLSPTPSNCTPHCADLNGEFSLTIDADNNCIWQYENSVHFCGFNGIDISIDSAGLLTVRIHGRYSSINWESYFAITLPLTDGKVDCDLVNELASYAGNNGALHSCDLTGATVHVSAA